MTYLIVIPVRLFQCTYVNHLKWKQQKNFSLKYLALCACKSDFPGVPFHYINLKKITTESLRNLVEVHIEHAQAERTCQNGLDSL